MKVNGQSQTPTNSPHGGETFC